ncbi:DNA-3-methyladenine glycosylase 2 family protein [Rossellomorea vietnamensis]|uniref:DNA-3-methyladenine glycosylase II n=1 Tax=Rossellomorea vietnamensis TaxID=218284 RepID=A0A5D4M1U1_9BACI|nr:DNA-3-methyladenine glycosylase [Rossellomorea vietnamensis]TYR95318.1 DNA-3-methyladenine glycosylase 2 family protein [Rossellomorea vietnamensis]
MREEVIRVSPPYNFDLVLDRLSLDPLNNVDIENRTVKVPFYNDDNEVLTVTATGTTDNPSFLVEMDQEDEDGSRLAYLKRIFQWEGTLHDIHQHFLETDLKDIFLEHSGTPVVLEFSPYATLMKSIIHQQLNLSFAHTLTERFVHKYGELKDGVWFYPHPAKTALIEVAELRDLQFSQRKAEYVIGVSKEIAEGRLNLEELQEQSDEEILKQLVKLRGIGPWTAENYLMFALDRPNLFPKTDIGIQNALKKLYRMDRKPTLAEIEEMSAAWKPYLSYASLYLWRSIENRK